MELLTSTLNNFPFLSYFFLDKKITEPIQSRLKYPPSHKWMVIESNKQREHLVSNHHIQIMLIAN